MREVRTGFFATRGDGQDLRHYALVVPTREKRVMGVSFTSGCWRVPPGFYRVTIESWTPPGAGSQSKKEEKVSRYRKKPVVVEAYQDWITPSTEGSPCKKLDTSKAVHGRAWVEEGEQ